MARGARGVTCSNCGCLNFSSEHELCDKCRAKTPTFRSTARHASAIRQREDAVHSNGKKRRFEATKSTSNKHHQQATPPLPTTKKQPDVIDLVSDDEEEDVEVQKVLQESLRTVKSRETDNAGGSFQSRVFPTATFKESDFLSLEEGVVMRKVAYSQPAAGRIAVKVGQAPSQPAPVVIRPTTGSSLQHVAQAKEKPVDRKPAEPRPPPENKEKTPTSVKVSGDGTGKTTGKEADAAVGKKAVQAVESVVQSKKSGEDPCFQSRGFDTVEFQASDFVTVFDGPPVARRSHPPSVNSSESSKVATSTSVGPAAPTVSTPEVTGPAKTATAAGSSTVKPASPEPTKKPTPDTTKKPTLEAKPAAAAAMAPAKSIGVTTALAPKAMAVAAPAPTPAKSSTLPPSTKTLWPASKPTLASTTAAVLPPAASKPNPVQVAPAFSKPTTQGNPTCSLPAPPEAKTKVSATATAGMPPVVPSKSSSAWAAVARCATMTPIPSTFSPAPAVAVSKPAPATMNSLSKAIPSTTTKGAIVVDHAASKAASVSSTTSVWSKAEASANMILPKRMHPEGAQRTDEAKKRTKPLASMMKSSDADAVLFVKVNAAPLEMAPVEPPVMGYCSPELLAFMRECGDEDADEDDDPEEVSRSQLKLLNVVDLTNLSDSEDSDTESPLPTPRASVTSATTQRQGLPAKMQMKDTGPPVATSTTTASGNRKWFVPTLDSERTRNRPQMVTCELCEENGLPSRLVRCPTCTKYYHRKCARENGDEKKCWNCELGSMIDDSELDEEHAKHDNEYLAYLRAIRRSASPDNGDEEEEEQEEVEEDDAENQEGGDEDAIGDGDVEMASPAEDGENNNPLSEESDAKSAGKSWKEFVGGATADVDDTFHEVTKRIAEELGDDEKKHIYSRGFVSRNEFETQMAEVEEYYISEEARLQQLEREKAIEGRKAAEARRAQAAEQAALASASNDEQPGDSENKPPSVSTNDVQPAVDHCASVPPASNAAATIPNAAQRNNTPAVTSTVAAASPPVPTIAPRPAFYAVPGSGPTFAAAFRPTAAKPTTAPPPATQH